MSLQFAREDYRLIIGDGEFKSSCTFTSVSTPVVTATISGLFVEHHTSINTDGMAVNSKMARLTIAEADLLALNYQTRNSANRVALNKHKVSVIDINEVSRNYVVTEVLPDNGIGGITLILGDNTIT